MSNQTFKKGDNVFHAAYGWGKVIDINEQLECPVEVQFLDWGYETFTQDGRTYPSYPMVLSFTEYTLEGFSLERLEELPELGEVVWVRDKDTDDWEVTHFVKKDNLGFHVSNDMKSYHITIYNQLITKNPYKHEK